MRDKDRDLTEILPSVRVAARVARVRCPECRTWVSIDAGCCTFCGMDVDASEHGAEIQEFDD